MAAICFQSIDFAVRIFGDIVAAGLRSPFQCFKVFRRDYVALLDNHPVSWAKDNVFFGLLAYCRPYLGECLAFSLSCCLEFLLAPCLNFLLIRSIAAQRVLNIALTLLFQAIDAFDNPVIQVLIELDQLFIYMHQFLLARFLINMRDDLERKVEDTLQVTWRKI